MVWVPRITEGLGKLTPELWDRQMAMLLFFEENYGELRNIASKTSMRTWSKPFFMARITGSLAMGGGASNRWKYAWTEVLMQTDDTFDDKTNGLSGDTGTDYAINLCEIDNTSTDVGPGVMLNGPNYPSNFAPLAIGTLFDEQSPGGTGADLDSEVQVVVPMYQIRDNDNAVRYVFFAANAHDGDCS